MLLAEEEQEVGQFRVRQRVTLSEQDTLQLAASGEHVAESANILLAVGEGQVCCSVGRGRPVEYLAVPILAQHAQNAGQKCLCPAQCPGNPAPELAAIDARRVAAKLAGERRQGEALDDEAPNDGENLSEARRLVGDVGAGGDTRPSAAGKGELLDEQGPRGVPGRAAAPAVTTKRTESGSDEGADHPDPGGMILGG